MAEFVEGWSIIQTLGEGSYGEVKLLMNRASGGAVAMKAIDLKKHPNAKAEVRKEVLIHSTLADTNIIKYYGQRQETNFVYIFLEYAEGGELFDKIEPDIGMPHWQAQKYFMQLLAGVEYLHNRGITHRDLKPENLLLDNHNNLKISDFGMATFFRMREKERMLDKKCGTLPYVAPEVLTHPYQAQPADIWSCGIILVALLAGELPWDKPVLDCKEYVLWKINQYAHTTPWLKIDTLALSLIRNMLVPHPPTRITLEKIKCHRWCKKRFTSVTSDSYSSNPWGNKALSASKLGISDDCVDGERLCYSQPQAISICEIGDEESNLSLFSFSQPTQIDNLLISSQLINTQSPISPDNFSQKLVRRMTRFFIKLDISAAFSTLMSIFDGLGYTCKSYNNFMITIYTIDRRKTPLTFKASILTMIDQTLLDFRLSRGCGIEFKRCFIIIKKELEDVVVKGPVTWPVDIPNCVP